MNTHQLDFSPRQESRGRALSVTIAEGLMAGVPGTPMLNLTVRSGLKTWIDQILRIGRTFRSTPAGKVGNAAGSPRIHRFRRCLQRRARQPVGLSHLRLS